PGTNAQRRPGRVHQPLAAGPPADPATATLPVPASRPAVDRSRLAPRRPGGGRVEPRSGPLPGCPWATASTAAPGPATASPDANAPAPRRTGVRERPVAGTP